ncbi:DUF202 domain-containing protein [Alginatibacterium sediminis]|uniref:DUF202 domain-containing protein n=1 Tax=Alginatibacterium sediminis TaxID=2164068 RepID=A0A420E6E8_9ALTE|nr:DUF202 domain-containing protein [Alginatibacterium sediminis]RKF13729.1 DUF202 domain-containing protein [Alginatibacterium sediminis]
MTWRKKGEAPDYRFSLANERTYLAWIRTALALLAGAIGIDQLAPNLARPEVRILLSLFLCIGAGLVAFYAYRRWASNEQAMRLNQEIQYTGFLKITSIVMVILAFAAALVILL